MEEDRRTEKSQIDKTYITKFLKMLIRIKQISLQKNKYFLNVYNLLSPVWLLKF